MVAVNRPFHLAPHCDVKSNDENRRKRCNIEYLRSFSLTQYLHRFFFYSFYISLGLLQTKHIRPLFYRNYIQTAGPCNRHVGAYTEREMSATLHELSGRETSLYLKAAQSIRLPIANPVFLCPDL